MDDDNQDIIDALKQPYTGVKPYPGKGPTVQPNTPFANWAQGMGESGKDSIVDLLKHPENLPSTGELGVIAGPRALTANMGNYHKAMDRFLRGGDPEKTFDKTSWFPRQEGQMAFEIPDTGLRSQPLPKTKPGEALFGQYQAFASHPKLFEAYPQVQEMPTHIIPSYGPETSGKFNYPEPGHMTIGGPINSQGLTPEQLRTLAHETQHGIQGIEGWGFGSNPEWIKDRLSQIGTGGIPEDYPMRDEIIGHLLNTNPKNVPYGMYYHHPSEVEARNVMDRFMFDKYGQDTSFPRTFRRSDLNAALKGTGMQVGLDNTIRQFLPNDRFRTLKPEDLPQSVRQIYDRLPIPMTEVKAGAAGFNRMIGDRKYPWKTEDLPRDQQYDYWKFLR